jgi:hypothetical protein
MICVIAIVAYLAIVSAQKLTWPEWAKRPSPIIYDRGATWEKGMVRMRDDHYTIVSDALSVLQTSNSYAELDSSLAKDLSHLCPTVPMPGYFLVCEPSTTFDNGLTNEDTAGRVVGVHLANLRLGSLRGGYLFAKTLATLENLIVVDLHNNGLSGPIFEINGPDNLDYLDLSLNSFDSSPSVSLFDLIWPLRRLKFCRIVAMTRAENNCIGTQLQHEEHEVCGPPKIPGGEKLIYNTCPSRPTQAQLLYFDQIQKYKEERGRPLSTPFVGARGFFVDAPHLYNGPDGSVRLPVLPSSFSPQGREYDGANPIPLDQWEEYFWNGGPLVRPSPTSEDAPSISATNEESSQGASAEDEDGASGLSAQKEAAIRPPTAPGTDINYLLVVGGCVGGCFVVALLAGVLVAGYYCGRGSQKEREAIGRIESAVSRSGSQQEMRSGFGAPQMGAGYFSDEWQSTRNDSQYGRVTLSPPSVPPFVDNGDYGPAPPEIGEGYDSVERTAANPYEEVSTPQTGHYDRVDSMLDHPSAHSVPYIGVKDTFA